MDENSWKLAKTTNTQGKPTTAKTSSMYVRKKTFLSVYWKGLYVNDLLLKFIFRASLKFKAVLFKSPEVKNSRGYFSNSKKIQC